MARFVVLSFEDNEAAEAFARELHKWGVIEVAGTEGPTDTRVEGMYAKPTSFCAEGPCRDLGKRVPEFSRGQKYGWLVCSACRQPSRSWGSDVATVIGSSKDLWEPSTSQEGENQAIRGPEVELHPSYALEL